MGPFDPLLRYFFGRDIFISYSRRDADRYAVALVNALTGESPAPACYLDRWAAPPDADLPASLRRHLRWSGMLVLIATPESVRSQSVLKELRLFPRSRIVLPIEVAGALDTVDRGAQPWSAIGGAAPERESAEALLRGQPSPAVIERIRKCVTFTRQDQRLQRAVFGTAASIVLLLLASMLTAGQVIRDAKADAAAKVGEAEEQVATARRSAEIAGCEEAAARTQARVARADTERATRDAVTAKGQAARARANATTANAEANRQLEIARAHRLGSEAQAVRGGHPERLPRSVLLGAEAVRRLRETGTRSKETSAALRRSVEMLPRLARVIEHPNGVSAVTSSASAPVVATASKMDIEVWDGRSSPPAIHRWKNRASITQLTLDHLGRYLAVSGADHFVRVIEPATGEELFALEQSDGVSRMAFSGDGRLLLTSSGGVVQVCRVPSGEIVSRFLAHLGEMGFAEDGSRIASAGSGGFRVYDARTGAPTAYAKPGVNAELFSAAPNGRYLAIASLRNVSWYDVDADSSVESAIQYTGPVHDLADRILAIEVSSDGTVAVRFRGRLDLWRVEGGNARLLEQFPVSEWGEAVTFSADGSAVGAISSEPEKTTLVQVFETASSRARIGSLREEIARITIPGTSSMLRFGNHGRIAVTANDNWYYGNHRIRIWDLGGAGRIPSVPAVETSKATYSSDGTLMARYAGRSEIQIRDATTGALLSRLGDLLQLIRMAFSPDGRYLVTTSSDGLQIWTDLTSGTPKLAARIEGREFGILAISPGGTYLAVSVPGGVSIMADWTHAPREVSRLAAEINAMAFSPDENFIAASHDRPSGAEHAVSIFRAADGERVGTISLKDQAHDVDFSRSGRFLAAGVANHARIWENWTSGAPREIASFEHHGPVWHVRFSGDERFLATAGEEKVARVWALAEGAEVAAIRHDDYVTALAFSSDSSRLHQTTWDGGAWISLVDDAALLREACTRITRNLTEAEWREHDVGGEWRETCAGLPLRVDLAGPPGDSPPRETWPGSKQPEPVRPETARQLEAAADRFLERMREGVAFPLLVEEFYVTAPELRRQIVNKAARRAEGPAFVYCDPNERERIFLDVTAARIRTWDVSIPDFLRRPDRTYVTRDAFNYGFVGDATMYAVLRRPYQFVMIEEQNEWKIVGIDEAPLMDD